MAEKVQHNVSLTPGTVQKVAQEEVTTITRRKSGKGRVTSYSVNARTVPAAVLKEALRLAGGDISRLRMDDDGSVTVVNQSRQR